MARKGESSLTNGYIEVPKTSFKANLHGIRKYTTKALPTSFFTPMADMAGWSPHHTHSVMHGFGILLLIILSTDVTVHQEKPVCEMQFQG